MIVLVVVPALVQAYIFVLESLSWGKPRTNAVFGVKPDQVEVIRSWAFNQGWYNLFLAIAMVVGLLLRIGGGPGGRDGALVGAALVGYGALSMVAAGLVLVVSNPKMVRSALVQIVPGLVGLLGLVV